MKLPNTPAILLWLFCWVTFSPPLLAGTLTLQGRVDPVIVGWKPGAERMMGKSVLHAPFPFQLERDESGAFALSFDSTRFNSPTNGKISLCQIVSDTTQLWLVTQQKGKLAPDGTWRDVTPPYHYIAVRSSPLPLFETLDSRGGWPFIWMTYLADTVWKDSFTNQRPSLFEIPQRVEDFGYRWVFAAFPTTDLMPDRVEVRRDTALDRPLAEELQNLELPYPEAKSTYEDAVHMLNRRLAIPNGFARIKGEVSTRTNCGAFRIPMDTTYTVATPDDAGTPFYQYRIRIDAASYSSSPLVLPPLPEGTAYVTDERFRVRNPRQHVNAITYQTKNDYELASVDTPRLRQGAEAELSHSDSQSFTRQASIRKALLGLLAVTLLIGSLVVYRRRCHRTAAAAVRD